MRIKKTFDAMIPQTFFSMEGMTSGRGVNDVW